jgi:hypothetical protein
VSLVDVEDLDIVIIENMHKRILYIVVPLVVDIVYAVVSSLIVRYHHHHPENVSNNQSVVEGMSSSLSSSPSLIETDGLWVNSDLLLLDYRQEVSILFNIVSPLACMLSGGWIALSITGQSTTVNIFNTKPNHDECLML